MTAYTAVFYIYTFKKSSLLKQVVLMVFFVIFIIGYIAVEEDNEVLLGRLGKTCSLSLAISPYIHLVHNYRLRKQYAKL
jgi:uncharacterized membrane protein